MLKEAKKVPGGLELLPITLNFVPGGQELLPQSLF